METLKRRVRASLSKIPGSEEPWKCWTNERRGQSITTTLTEAINVLMETVEPTEKSEAILNAVARNIERLAK